MLLETLCGWFGRCVCLVVGGFVMCVVGWCFCVWCFSLLIVLVNSVIMVCSLYCVVWFRCFSSSSFNVLLLRVWVFVWYLCFACGFVFVGLLWGG